jgi:hypothetical protein
MKKTSKDSVFFVHSQPSPQLLPTFEPGAVSMTVSHLQDGSWPFPVPRPVLRPLLSLLLEPTLSEYSAAPVFDDAVRTASRPFLALYRQSAVPNLTGVYAQARLTQPMAF